MLDRVSAPDVSATRYRLDIRPSACLCESVCVCVHACVCVMRCHRMCEQHDCAEASVLISAEGGRCLNQAITW